MATRGEDWASQGQPKGKAAQDERLLLNHTNTLGFLAPGGEEFNPGPETRLDRSELLCNKVFQYFGHLMQRVDSLEKILMLGGIGGRKIKLYYTKALSDQALSLAPD